MQRLPEDYRLPVLLCFFEGRTHAEAAQNKLSFARSCHVELDGLRRGEEEERPEIQRSFEGLLSSGTSAAVPCAGKLSPGGPR